MIKLILVVVLLFGFTTLIQSKTFYEPRFQVNDPINVTCSFLTNCSDCSSNYPCFWCSTTSKCYGAPLQSTCDSGFCQGDSCECESPCTNGFFPCSEKVTGIIILLFFYGILLAVGAKFISDGSELLLEILDPGIIGGLLIPALGAVPDAAIVVVSGALGSVAEAQENLAVGVGTLAGSTVMLLTIPWCLSLFLARTDIRHNQSVDLVRTKPFYNLKEQGTTVDNDTRNGCKIMVFTAISYIVGQGVAFAYLKDDDGDAARHTEKWFAIAGSVLCFMFLLGYFYYQVRYPQLQQKKIRAAKENLRLQTGVNAFMFSLRDNRPADQTIDVEAGEALLINSSTGSRSAGAARKEEEERKVHAAMVRHYGLLWRSRAKQRAAAAGKAKKKDDDSEEEDSEGEGAGEEGVKDSKTKMKIIFEAMFWLVLGTAIVTIFSDPMVDVITDFGKKLNIKAFFLSFLITPFCSNASELISSLIFASKMKKQNSSLTYSALYGAATMNNTMVLGIFYMLIWVRGLAWTFSAEVMAILFVTVSIGLVGIFRNTLRLYWALIVILLYPASLGLVVLLESTAGWH